MTEPAIPPISRRSFVTGTLATSLAAAAGFAPRQAERPKAQIAITFDLEMSRHYPRRGMLEWDYQKGNLDEPTKNYSVKAAEVAAELGGVIHFFLVGRVLEHASIDWIRTIANAGHPIGNHTYDHVNLLADTPEKTQYRFQRSPWLIRDRSTAQLLRENIELTTIAMRKRAQIEPNGFRTPGGFRNGLTDREDLQKMLLGQGFQFVSSKYPQHLSGETGKPPGPEVYADIVRAQQEAQPFAYPSGLVEIPMSPISDVGAFRTRLWKLDYFLKAVRLAVEWAIETGGVFDFLCHPSCMVVEDPKFKTIRLICELVKQAGDRAEIVGLDAIAKRIAN